MGQSEERNSADLQEIYLMLESMLNRYRKSPQLKHAHGQLFLQDMLDAKEMIRSLKRRATPEYVEWACQQSAETFGSLVDYATLGKRVYEVMKQTEAEQREGAPKAAKR